MISLGFIAAFFTTVSFIPQAIQTIKTRDTSGISLPMYTLFFIGVSLWIIYGWHIQDFSILIGNGLVLMFIIPILYIKVKSTMAVAKSCTS